MFSSMRVCATSREEPRVGERNCATCRGSTVPPSIRAAAHSRCSHRKHTPPDVNLYLFYTPNRITGRKRLPSEKKTDPIVLPLFRFFSASICYPGREGPPGLSGVNLPNRRDCPGHPLPKRFFPPISSSAAGEDSKVWV